MLEMLLPNPTRKGIHMTTRVLFAGMDGAGKSTLACSVYAVLKSWSIDVGLHELDVWSDTHDPILGRKPWGERNKRGNDVRNYLADEFAGAVDRFVTDERHRLIIGDLHGRWQMPDYRFWAGLTADWAVLVERQPTVKDRLINSPQRIADWERFLESFKIPIRLRVFSRLAGQSVPSGRLPVTDLDRQLCHENPEVWQAATAIMDELGER